MKRRLLLLITISLLAVVKGAAQILPTEKLFFASDRMKYTTGDTIRVAGCLIRTDNLTIPADGDVTTEPYSRYLYLDLLDASDSTLTRQRLVTDDNGSFTTTFAIDPTSATGIYTLRAYTRLMCNYSDYTIPAFPIRIISESQSPTQMQGHDAVGGSLTCNLYAEGGRLATDDVQKVAVCLRTADGRGLATRFSLVDDRSDTLQYGQTTPSGWAVVSFYATPERRYFIATAHEGRTQLFVLPETDDGSPSLKLTKGKDKAGYHVSGQLPKGSKLYAYHQTTGLLLLPLKKDGILDLADVGSGVVSLMLTDRNDSLLSESHCWHEASLTTTADTVFRLVRYLPVDDSQDAVETNFIPTAEVMLNYQQDLVSPEPFPACYATESVADRVTDVQGWLLSARFSRLDVAKVMREGWHTRYQPETAPLIRGKVMGGGKQWRLKEGTVVAYQRSTADTFSADLRRDGTFVLPVGTYPDGDDFFIEAFDKKGNAGVYDYEFLGDTIPSLRNHSRWLTQTKSGVVGQAGENRKAFSFTGTNMIPEVVAHAKVKTDYEQERKEYYGNKYISEEAMDKSNYQTFQQMLYHFAPYMRLIPEDPEDKSGPPEWHLFPATRISTLGGTDEIRIYVDGVLLTATEAFGLDMQSVATVEFMTPAQALARHQGCINGCLEITTKRFKPTVVRSKGVIYTPPLGIANIGQPSAFANPETPTKAGNYLLIVDEISSGGINTYAKQVTVAP